VKRKNHRQDASGKTTQQTKMKSKSAIAKAYGIPLSTLLPYLKNIILVNSRLCKGVDILKHMRIHGAKDHNMENELFDWFCHAQNNSMTGFAMFKKQYGSGWLNNENKG
jgi:hypothetical protein